MPKEKRLHQDDKTVTFFDMVLQVVQLIPEGRVTSYGAIAKYLGAARSSRMVGWALNSSSAVNRIPAHRVVNRKGVLTASGNFKTTPMHTLLEREGIEIVENQIVDFKRHFWDPSEELSIE